MRTASVLIFLVCCSRPTEQQGNPSSAPQTSSSVPGERVTTIAGPKELAWDTPEKWQTMANTSAIRKATYSIPAADGDNGVATQLTVTTAGGTVEANIERWQGQFKYPELKRSNMDAHGVKITFVEVRGTFTESMGAAGQPKAKQVLLGAIAETQPDLTFFKMTGPEKTVDAAKADFFKLVSTIRPK